MCVVSPPQLMNQYLYVGHLAAHLRNAPCAISYHCNNYRSTVCYYAREIPYPYAYILHCNQSESALPKSSRLVYHQVCRVIFVPPLIRPEIVTKNSNVSFVVI